MRAQARIVMGGPKNRKKLVILAEKRSLVAVIEEGERGENWRNATLMPKPCALHESGLYKWRGLRTAGGKRLPLESLDLEGGMPANDPIEGGNDERADRVYPVLAEKAQRQSLTG